MKPAISRAVAALALLTCLICPVLEMFDRWDHTLQTGQDTEYALVLLALCVGAACAFVKFVVPRLALSILAPLTAHLRCSEPVLPSRSDCLLIVPTEGSPPRLALRI